MLKWVLGLCAALYGILLYFGEPTPEELAAREARELQQVTRSETVALVTQSLSEEEAEPEPAPVLSQTPEPTSEPTSEIESPVLVSASPSTDATAEPTPVVTATTIAEPAPQLETQAEPEQSASAASSNEIWRVTARAVNLRAGPSTNNAVVGRATLNDSAEIIEMLPSGWAKVYILETGTEAFMSAQFLAAPE
ncbi:SH3 domain-containing protein [Litoreibacter ponti]|uniref:SH3 domain-containing protein n=1 Tax=Litoreibacter ponti TaxID=1510457 RepID=A0A2T6BMI8_9RHOB|nr:SH3 domain-containing protein [Litoreibacter ponti]PTX57271.1 SH3 domain-containing protein [Litoreibacter ponti]